MPLTIAGSDLKKGTITLVVQEVGLSSTRLCELNEGESITDVVGPLGQATHIEKIRNSNLRWWWCRCGSDASYRTGFEGCR